VRIDKRWFATPLFIVVLVVEITDLVFAIDSIPAILAISRDPFIVYTSNAFAILGLRSLFFALAGLLNLLQYLKYGLSVVLMFIGSKMVLAEWVHISTGVSLLVVVSVLGISTIASLLSPARRKKKQADA
jgi:tellurite resistance protein TerC